MVAIGPQAGGRTGMLLKPMRPLVLASLVLALAACTTPLPAPVPASAPVGVTPPPVSPVPPPPAPAPPAAPTPEALAREATQSLLRFHERVRDLPAAELAREITRLEARLAVGPAAASLPVPPASSAPAAAQPASAAASGAAAAPPAASPSVTPLPAAPQTPAGAPNLAQHSLELALLLAQQRQNGDLARALSLVEPLQRPGAPASTQPLARLLFARLSEQRRLEEQLERQASAVRDLQRRADQLAAQLEALRAIERSLNTRPPGPALPVPTPAPAAPGPR